SQEYDTLRDIYRPGHADFSYAAKYGHRDHRGGGRSSGRETVSRVVGGAIAQTFLRREGITATAYTHEFGGIQAETIAPEKAHELPYFAPDPSVVELWDKRVTEIKKEGDTLGGIVEVLIQGVPAGLGEPVFDKLDARLAAACMSVGAVKSVEIGIGRQAARLTGSQNNEPPDPSLSDKNYAGGILGGISNGAPIILRVAVKPIPSIAQEQEVATTERTLSSYRIQGRHDISAIPRIVPVLKAMVLLTLADMLLLQRSAQLGS
ncbi:MAG: chorismate synthase, partial [Desulfohalobium sp.]